MESGPAGGFAIYPYWSKGGTGGKLDVPGCRRISGGAVRLGFMIMDARQLLLTERVLVGISQIGLLGFLIDKGIRYVEAKKVAWFYKERIT